ncbi:uncharacterized protein [Coffea arabica]|uniref:Chromo domain-containing protein n=1 Tax=Coffea arabica TaxID=13443 RepID=A0ABM4W8F0_COFAR
MQTKVATVEDYMRDRKRMDELLQHNLKAAQERMKKYAGDHMSEREFQVGDWVYLRLQPYRQSSVMIRNNTKLSAKYFGPYSIEEKIGKVACRLRLGHQITPILQLPDTDEKGQIRVEPMALLSRRMIKRKNAAVTQWLIQWWGAERAEATWEDAK